MWMPVSFSTLATSSGGPSMAKAALIIWEPWPGTSVRVSRGMDIIVRPPEPVWSTMIVSVFVPPRSPVCSALRCASVRSSALSEPTIR